MAAVVLIVPALRTTNRSPKAGVKQQLYRHARVGAAQYRCQRMLAIHHCPHACSGGMGMQRMASKEPLMTLLQPAQHRRRALLRRKLVECIIQLGGAAGSVMAKAGEAEGERRQCPRPARQYP